MSMDERNSPMGQVFERLNTADPNRKGETLPLVPCDASDTITESWVTEEEKRKVEEEKRKVAEERKKAKARERAARLRIISQCMHELSLGEEPLPDNDSEGLGGLSIRRDEQGKGEMKKRKREKSGNGSEMEGEG